MKHFSAVCLLAVFLICIPIESRADLINGDFSEDLITYDDYIAGVSGWVADENYGDPTVLVDVVNEQAVLSTGGIESGPYIVSLWQWFEIPDWAATISFDISFLNTDGDLDPSGSSFPDYFEVSYWDDLSGGYDEFFIGADTNGFYDYDYSSFEYSSLFPENLGNNWFRFSTSISQLAGRSGTLYFDLLDMDDGFYSTAKVDNVIISGQASTPVPEPAGVMLLGSGLFGLLCFVHRGRKQ